MASFIPIYLKTYYKNDSYFHDSKIVLSVYNEEDAAFDASIVEKLKFDNITDLTAFKNPSFQQFVIESMDLVDMVVKGDEFLQDSLDEAFSKTKTAKSEYIGADSIETLY